MDDKMCANVCLHTKQRNTYRVKDILSIGGEFMPPSYDEMYLFKFFKVINLILTFSPDIKIRLLIINSSVILKIY